MLLQKIADIDEQTKQEIQSRIKEFENCEDWFSELCYCILTANASAKSAIRAQEEIKNEFQKLTKRQISARLQKVGYRFYNKRAEYIEHAKQFADIRGIVRWLGDGKTAREWLIRNIKGFGYKEASHFLRNVGFKDVAIADRHILRLLKENRLIEGCHHSLKKEQYIQIESVLEELAKKSGLNLAELDLCLWYLKTGKVLK